MSDDQGAKLKRLIILSAPSGGGKSTVAKHLMKLYPEIKFAVSATTRAKREGEQHGREYYFISKEEFKEKIENNEFVEYEQIFDNYYGTLKSEIFKAFERNEILLFDVDIKGAKSISKSFPDDVLMIFIMTPDMKILEHRLRNRGTESEEQIKLRLERSEMEINEASGIFEYYIFNNDLDTLLQDSESIVNEKVFGIAN